MHLYPLKFVAFFSGCLSCYLLQVKLGFSPVFSSALTGFLGSFLHFPKVVESKGLHSAIYAGTFAGMCSHEVIEHPGHIFLLSIIGTVLYFFSKPHLNGFGGKLGTISFVSSAIFIIAKSAW
jgi:hypothetical protein